MIEESGIIQMKDGWKRNNKPVEETIKMYHDLLTYIRIFFKSMQEKEFILRDVWEISVHMYWLNDETERERERQRDKDRERERQTKTDVDIERWKEIYVHVEYKEIKKQRIPVVLVLLMH